MKDIYEFIYESTQLNNFGGKLLFERFWYKKVGANFEPTSKECCVSMEKCERVVLLDFVVHAFVNCLYFF